MDRTLILVKPDAFARGLTGEILARFERKGLEIVALRGLTVTRELAEQHYAEHSERPFFGELVEFITSAPIVALVLEGKDAVKAARQVIGATDPLEAAPGSIRGDYAVEMGQNMVHGSDSPESAAREAGAVLSRFAEVGRDSLRWSWPPARRNAGRSWSVWGWVHGAARRCRRAGPRRSRRGGARERAAQGARRHAVRWSGASLRGSRPAEIVLGCDTLVALDGAIYGKPADETIARATLRALSGPRMRW